jgi:acyl transferase domain-containing protein
LKRLSSAIADNDQVLDIIAAFTLYQNQNFTAITILNIASLSDLFSIVIYCAALKSNQISLVEAHGTGTPVKDPAEYDSVRKVFGGPIRKDTLSLDSVKGLFGYIESASRIVALIKRFLIIMQGAIPLQASSKPLIRPLTPCPLITSRLLRN